MSLEHWPWPQLSKETIIRIEELFEPLRESQRKAWEISFYNKYKMSFAEKQELVDSILDILNQEIPVFIKTQDLKIIISPKLYSQFGKKLDPKLRLFMMAW